ncbi:hypothetical protein SAMN04487820_11539 [Actinopolyspora mzabensis]|uniref:Uncharacterized protein n=1 Tax=Actinopolyspora mzabensis TaxID=995066 RepID=A0A1G9FHL4_ACTMZ|nr:hypothetical protein [Actinopolyspora mzabensis]SDK87846.1 hypothetical protein SAMN04487820_11539 [Actinopolyspora mzabensis]
MNIAIVMIGALLPILAASVFYVSDHRTPQRINRSPPNFEESGEYDMSTSGDLTPLTPMEHVAPTEQGPLDRRMSEAA